MEIKKTSLNKLHQSNNAKFVEFAGYEMPIQYSKGIIEEHKFTRSNSGIFATLIGLFMSPSIIVSANDIFLGFIAGFFQVGIGFILITIGARSTPSAFVGIIMLTEAVLGPFWAWIFANENPPILVILGGCIIIFAVFLQFFSKLEKVKKI